MELLPSQLLTQTYRLIELFSAFSCSDIQEITFKAGDNVTLECISNDAVESCEWRKSGKERNECLLQWRGASAWECNRDPSLRGRVVRSERRTDRSASVVLKTTDARDAGTYECEAASEGSRPELICIFELKFEGEFAELRR